MHLHTLTVQAIGPFAGRHTVDFAALGAGGLFLLEGPTGAGKSTLIDAVVFALYGKVASAATSDDRLRSAFAADGTESVVDLVFETGAGVFRVRRTPAYERAKRHGAGRTRQQATVTLWRLAGAPTRPEPDGEVLATRLDEAGIELQRIVGLDRTQFVQTIVLPQGEFSQFLRADPEQRRGLLQRIFGTEVYERVQQRLEEMRREAQRSVTSARSAVAEATARFVGAAGIDEDGATALRAAVEEDTTGLLGLTRQWVTGLRADAGRAAVVAAARASEAETARLELERAATVDRLVERRTELTAERAALDAREPEHDAAVTRLARARRAAQVRPFLLAADESGVALGAAVKEVQAAVDGVPADLAELVGLDRGAGLAPGVGSEPGSEADASADAAAGAVAARLEAVRREGVEAVAVLARPVELERTLPARQRQAADLRVEVVRARQVLDQLEAELAGRPAARLVLADALAAAARLAEGVPDREQDLARARRAHAAALLAERTERELAAAAAEHTRTVAAAVSAVRHEAALRTERLTGIAGELAVGLADGAACPVCGSLDHPAPAPLADGHVDAAQIDRASADRDQAERAAAVAQAAEAALTERLAGARDAADGLTSAAAHERVLGCEQALARASAAVAERDRCARAVQDHDDGGRALEAALRDRQAEHAELRERSARIDGAVEQDAAEVTHARGDHPSVLARQGAEQARVDAAGAVVAALAQAALARDEVAAHRARLDAALVEHAFAEADEARRAWLDGRDTAALEKQVAAHLAAAHRVAAELAEPDIAAVDPALGRETTRQDAVQARQAEEIARAAAAEARASSVGAEGRLTTVDGAAQQVEQAVATLADLAAQAEPVLRMAGLAAASSADNPEALSLATYVLLRRFEDVVAAANDRLVTMSDGRFELERSEEREDVRTRRAGLAMRVVDHVTGDARDPRTLSGGETFYVSLCLALGMADVVTAEAGGIDLGTLFVDEGFGSLDPHTLDAVLAELGRLRAGGRVVGVVSHVEALKSAIAERIEVRRCADGSSTLTVVAG